MDRWETNQKLTKYLFAINAFFVPSILSAASYFSSLRKPVESVREKIRIRDSCHLRTTSSPFSFSSSFTTHSEAITMTTSKPSPEEIQAVLECFRYGDLEEGDFEDIKKFTEAYGDEVLNELMDERGNTALHLCGGNGHQGKSLHSSWFKKLLHLEKGHTRRGHHVKGSTSYEKVTESLRIRLSWTRCPKSNRDSFWN